MAKTALLALGLAVSGVAIGTAFACDDVECPKHWVWSDAEGTCVEAPEGTS